jgi:transcriptional regulator with XRE-family HTH domain
LISASWLSKLAFSSSTMRPIGIKIKDLREKKHLSQQEVADELGMTQSNYHKLESDKIQIKLNVMKKLASFFDIHTSNHKVSPSILVMMSCWQYSKNRLKIKTKSSSQKTKPSGRKTKLSSQKTKLLNH